MIRFALLTVSDGVAQGDREDTSGRTARQWVDRNGWSVVEHRVVPDESLPIARALCEWADQAEADVILTLGGTGLGPRDITPEATNSVLDRASPGLSEALRAHGMTKTVYGMLSRGVAGVRGQSLIVNLPGSESAVREGLELLEQVIPHATDLLAGRTRHRS